MSCLSWNCIGLGVPLRVHAVRDMLHLLNPELVFLCETRCITGYVDTLKAQWNRYIFLVVSDVLAGGLVLLRRKDVEVSLLSYEMNHIDAEVLLLGETTKWRFNGLYGFPEQNQRHQTWDLLRHLSTRISLPWIAGGDFNEILADSEKSVGPLRAPSLMNAFHEGLFDCDLIDQGYVGPEFTWANNRAEPHTIRCLFIGFVVTVGGGSTPLQHKSST